MQHIDYPHGDRTLPACPACERPCAHDCADRDTSCVGDHGEAFEWGGLALTWSGLAKATREEASRVGS